MVLKVDLKTQSSTFFTGCSNSSINEIKAFQKRNYLLEPS